jgi:hypothetical protein
MPGLAIILAAQKDFFLKNLVFFYQKISPQSKEQIWSRTVRVFVYDLSKMTNWDL